MVGVNSHEVDRAVKGSGVKTVTSHQDVRGVRVGMIYAPTSGNGWGSLTFLSEPHREKAKMAGKASLEKAGSKNHFKMEHGTPWFRSCFPVWGPQATCFNTSHATKSLLIHMEGLQSDK